MRAVIVQAGIVVNAVSVPDQTFADAQGWVVSDDAVRGDLWDGTTFSKPQVVAEVYGIDDARKRMVKWIDGLTAQISMTPYDLTRFTSRNRLSILERLQ